MTHDLKEKTEVEDPAIEVLTQHLGWTEQTAQEADKLRPSRKEPVLVELLKEKIQDLNPWISEENADRVVRHITTLPATSVLEANEKIHAMLDLGTTVQQDLGDGWGERSRTVRLIDYDTIENNDFTVIRQYPVEHYSPCIPDIVLFVNGIPVTVIECKSPYINKAMAEGLKQLNRYQENGSKFRNQGCPQLFRTAQILIATHKLVAKAGTNYAPLRHWSEWKDPWPLTLEDLTLTLGRLPTSQDTLLFGTCSKENLLDLIRNCTVFEREAGQAVKKMAKYQQFRATDKILKQVTAPKRKGGFVWHWQGSGKSLTMEFTAVKLRRNKALANPTIVVVTDRTDLDQQIHGTFLHCGFPNPTNASSAADLKETLSHPVGQTVMTTIQKFQDAAAVYPTLTKEKNVFVLVDEAHRSQYNILAANMRKALPNACFIGFTGTPVSQKKRDTFAEFGDCIDRYDHRQSVTDKITVPIYYESRLPKLSITGNNLKDLSERLFGGYSDEQQAAFARKYVTKTAIAIAPDRVRKICENLLDHYQTQIEPNGFKAQIVAPNRLGAVRYKEALEALGRHDCAVLISTMHNDEERFKPYHTSKTEEQEIIRRFKEDDDLNIIVVCDKLLTGFDAPREQVMYLDGPLKEHTLLQAMGRVNRRHKGKEYGLVVDYWGLGDALRDALSMYDDDDIEGMVHTDFKKEILPHLQAAHRAAMNFFAPVPRMNRDEDYKQACILYLKPEDYRISFDQKFKRFSQYLDVLLPDPEALRYVPDLKLLADIRIGARNMFSEDDDPIEDLGAKVQKFIDDHLRADGILRVCEPISLYSTNFETEVGRLNSDDAKASMIEHAVKREIHLKLDEDPVFYEDLLARLNRIIEDYEQDRITSAERLTRLTGVLDDVKHPQRHAETLGLDPEVAPFYRVMAADIEDPEPLKEAATEICAVIKEYAVIDWQKKEDTKRVMRQKIKRVLRSVGYPKDRVHDTAVNLVDLAVRRYRG
ncbi:type I restriction endonuclease subunit R [Methanofollis aquaemaris]|uniref:type I site-specific deoxyribonuclease n=1 Tax=Methanofollis aquaemaris TaxID=126734 RepID=A0A8A3S338_9EURY|nr:type I restriction endonuclease subunit R [Methanofollis aquaemaris]QSZ66161.1 type I restriction endonuclease subunit R [Methanofollis aquaemaris]